MREPGYAVSGGGEHRPPRALTPVAGWRQFVEMAGLIAMKMLAGRDRDVMDIAVLLPYAKDLRTVDDLVDLMNRLMPEVYIEDETARIRAEKALKQVGLL